MPSGLTKFHKSVWLAPWYFLILLQEEDVVTYNNNKTSDGIMWTSNVLSNVGLVFIIVVPRQCGLCGGGGPPYHTPLGPHPFPCEKKKKKTQSLLNCIDPLFLVPDLCAALVQIPPMLAPTPMPTLIGETLDIYCKLSSSWSLIWSLRRVDARLRYLNKSFTLLYNRTALHVRHPNCCCCCPHLIPPLLCSGNHSSNQWSHLLVLTPHWTTM